MTYMLILGILASFTITVLSTKSFSQKFKEWGITGLDIHKPDQPVQAEMGGAGILLGFGSTFLFAIMLGLIPDATLCGAILTIFLIGLIGIMDDIVAIRQRYKPLLVAAATIPMILTYKGRGEIWFPLIGVLTLGLLYPFFILPLAVTSSANFANMLAGFNGLEAGVGSIALGSLGLLSLRLGMFNIALIALLLAAAFAGFLIYNRFPARIFPGDSGTLVSGAAIAVVGILGGLEFAAIVVSIPAAFDFTLKMLHRRPFAQRSIYGNTTIRQDGYLQPPPYPSLSHAFAKVTALNEKSLVGAILFMEALYAIVAVAVTLMLH